MTPTENKVRRRVPVLGLEVDLSSYDDAISTITELARSGRGGYVCVTNVHVAIEARDDPKFEKLVNEPRRLFSRYLMVNPRFVWLASKQLIRAKATKK